MRNNFCSVFAAAGLLWFAACALDAAPENTADNAWHRSRDQYFNAAAWRAHIFDRVRTDLDHVAFGQADRDRIANTQAQATELQSNLTAGKYDQPALDNAIADLEDVVADGGLNVRDRDMLADDVRRVRDYRANHENWR